MKSLRKSTAQYFYENLADTTSDPDAFQHDVYFDCATSDSQEIAESWGTFGKTMTRWMAKGIREAVGWTAENVFKVGDPFLSDDGCVCLECSDNEEQKTAWIRHHMHSGRLKYLVHNLRKQYDDYHCCHN